MKIFLPEKKYVTLLFLHAIMTDKKKHLIVDQVKYCSIVKGWREF